MRLWIVLLLSVASVGVASQRLPGNLEIYAVDVEGGKATLVVSPSGESLLIDTGNIGEGAERDAQRILAAVSDAGLERIDHLMTTHWHRDHMGAIGLLAARVPILEFVDHGPNTQPDVPVDAFLLKGYRELYAGSKRTVVRPGDKIELVDLDVHVVASAGDVIKRPLHGAGAPNAYCPASPPERAHNTENTHAIGIRITFGEFRVVDLADLTDDREFDLMCPNNLIGSADLFMVSHHGQPRANSTALVHAIESRVAIMNNGMAKGGHPEVMRVIHSAPGLEDLWQLHASQLGGDEYDSPGLFVANVSPPPHDGPAYWIKVSARHDGSFAVTNSRNGFTKPGTYESRGR